ncbi:MULTISPECIES: YHYH protein [Alteromonadaceae]|uniref:YHYH protein n=1 Tax=Alteromonadaceae TaxID=72275 RepID=UPI001C07FA1E|nr:MULTISPECIES: YHYH protein [Aliiglaciecola]MBU2878470.1 YHYH protein [Aliiglaciecola lipolytica]MDO6709714.1 YHYH protein [Aliiglaciecola sp. 2_MG-2023]MDO6750744.1 YHYH protein [Aliiglaciecola sp. 1_MG-2023]
MQKKSCFALSLIISSVLLYGCNGSQTDDVTVDDGSSSDDSSLTTQSTFDPDVFHDGALLETPTIENCTLSGGTSTTCYRITIAGEPVTTDIGPFCPPTIYSDASEGGIWFDGSGEVYDIDGEFILNLANLYGADWQLYDPETGNVNVTNTQASCEGAARPNVAEEYQNHCVECSLTYFGGAVSQTFLIPVEPVAMSNPDSINNNDLGITVNGVVLAPPAPVDAILAANTIAAFDDCGGHINPFEGYHYHASTGCTESVFQDDNHASLLGYAIDGYGIYGMLNMSGEEDYDLDECRGHSDDTRGYHYHSASAGENMFIGCFKGEQGYLVSE